MGAANKHMLTWQPPGLPLHFLLHSVQCCFHQCAESNFIMHSHLGKNLAIYLDIGSMNSVHQLTIAHTMHTCSRVDTCNPQAAHITLAITAVAIHISHLAHDRLMCRTDKKATCRTMALGPLYNLFF